jgi:PAS domain S-box-containing protein
MASTVATSEELAGTQTGPQPQTVRGRSAWFRLGLRARQIALITLLVATVVAITTTVNVAHLTDVIVNRAQQEVEQLSNQIGYAVQQELSVEPSGDKSVSYARLAAPHSGVRSVMESTIVTSRTISYLYLTDSSGQIISDADGRFELAANRHVIGNPPIHRPDFGAFTRQNGYFGLLRILFGAPIYEYRWPITGPDNVILGELHVGVSTAGIGYELSSPLIINLIIGLVAIIFAAIVAIGSANLLLRPLKAISSSIDHLSLGNGTTSMAEFPMPRDEMVTDVTARLRLLGERLAGERSELELMRGRLRQVISHLEERLLLVNREGRVILASPDAEQIIGLNAADWSGLTIADFLGLNHPLYQLIERAFSERRSIARSALQVPTEQGSRQLLVSVQYIEDAGEPVGALVSLRDSESFQRFESQWDLSKKLADLGRITSGIAHEVKNPLNAMVIHLEILRSKLESSSGNPTPQLEILDSEIKRLDRVVQTFLNFTRPVDMHLAPVDLNTLVSQVVALASTEASDRGVYIATHLANDQLLVKADTDLLKQALLNVIINGCQAMPEGGPLNISTSRNGDGSARISITDQGVGIPEDGRERIFQLYYTTKKGGTGIGLAQAFRAVQLHGGSIQFDSAVGSGTTFQITLPSAA